MSSPDNQLQIGSTEWCSLPELGIPMIKARVDSGARTSSLHAWRIRHRLRDGRDYVTFFVHPLQGDRRTMTRCEAPVVDRRRVKSSSGRGEQRFVIRTTLEIGGQRRSIELTLTGRDSMGHRMLLGREAMAGMLVAPDRSLLLGDRRAADLVDAYRDSSATGRALVIGVLAVPPGCPLLARLSAEAVRRGHRLFSVDAPPGRGGVGRVPVEEPPWDVLIPLPSRRFAADAGLLLRARQHEGVLAANDPVALLEARDRRLLLQRLDLQGIPVVATAWAPAGEVIELPGSTPWLVRTVADGVRLLADADAARGAMVDRARLVQGLGAKGGLLIRAMVAGARVRACRLDVEYERGVLERVGSGVRLALAHRNALRGAVRALGLGFAQVDAVVDGDCLHIVDVDPFAVRRTRIPGTARALVRLVERSMGVSAAPVQPS